MLTVILLKRERFLLHIFFYTACFTKKTARERNLALCTVVLPLVLFPTIRRCLQPHQGHRLAVDAVADFFWQVEE